jgi:uncharacterized membrane protein
MDTPSSTAPAEARRRSGQLTAALGVVVLVVALIFALNSIYTNWYAIFRAVHVLVAVFWVGGGLTLTVLAMRAQRLGNPKEVVTVANQAAFVGEKLFAPAGLVVFLMGIGMILNGDLGWNHFWVIAGLIGYVSTFVTGIGVLSPLAKKIAASAETNGPEHPQTLALIDRILLIARFDVAVLLLVVADMVTKPFS